MNDPENVWKIEHQKCKITLFRAFDKKISGYAFIFQLNLYSILLDFHSLI